MADYRNGTIPWSCCNGQEGTTCPSMDKVFKRGCVGPIKEAITEAVKVLGGVALGVAGVEVN